MYVARNKVRMHDTDMAGILYFAKQFRFVHDALEDFLAHEGIHFHELFRTKDFAFVIVHVEADYLAPVKVGDELEVAIAAEKIGTTSFTIDYKIVRSTDKVTVGTAKTVHVTLDPKTRQKIPIPASFKAILKKYHR